MTYQIDRSQFVEHGPALSAADAIARVHHAALYAALTGRQPQSDPTPSIHSSTKELAMNDQQYDRDYQASREALNAGASSLGRWLVSETVAIFDALHTVHFSAPWTTPRPR